jgi:hypothetical protein
VVPGGGVVSEGTQFTTQLTCFTSTRVQILTTAGSVCEERLHPLCPLAVYLLTSTKVQILTPAFFFFCEERLHSLCPLARHAQTATGSALEGGGFRQARPVGGAAHQGVGSNVCVCVCVCVYV